MERFYISQLFEVKEIKWPRQMIFVEHLDIGDWRWL